jgi:RHS repeat-associated protein
VDAPVVRFHDANTDGDYLDTGDNVLYYCQDANWNVTAVVSASGSVVERYMYAAYGKATVLEPDWSADADNLSDVANARLFQGEELNPETGLYSSRLRDGYHPTLGVWTSRDPAHTIDGSNVYQYCLSNPATGTDPMGLCFGTAPYVDQYEARGPAGDTGVTGATDGPQETENEYGPRLSPKEEAALRLGCELDDVKRQIANLTQKQKRLESDYYDMLDFLAEGLAQAETASKQYSQDKDDARGVGNSGAGQVRAGNEQVSNEVSRILGEKIDPVHVLEGKAVDKIGEWLFSSLGDNAFKVVKLGIEVALAANKIDLANRTGKDFVSMGQQMLSDSTSKFNNANAGFKRAEEEYRDTERQMYQVKLGYYDDSNKITAALTKAQKRNEELIQKQRDLRNND